MIKLDLTSHEVCCLHDILLNLFHKTDCNKPVHSLLGYHDFILIQKIAYQTRQHQDLRFSNKNKHMTPIFTEYCDWPKQPLDTNQFTDGQQAAINTHNQETKL
jgi:hypothetical protein